MFTADKTLVCIDCRGEFAFTASEQQFYADRQFSEPRRCASCRAIRKSGRANDGYGDGGYSTDRYSTGATGAGRTGTRELFSATCSSCGREAQVPFRPTSGKPVYCSDCFRSRRSY